MTFAAVPAILLAASAVQAREWRHDHGVSINGGGRDGITRCSQWGVEFDGRDAVLAEEHLTIPAAGANPLVAAPPENGGITVLGSDGRDFEITACKAADPEDRGLLDRIHVSREHGRLTVEGPDDAGWTAHLIIRAPKNASVSLEARNGPISLSEFSGNAAITSENGPVSLRRSSGNIEVRTTNGPISLNGGSGKIRLEADNGPLSVRLLDDAWQGAGLDGRTENGPVHLEIARNYDSGVLVATAGRSPVHCGADACQHARRNWDDDGKTIAFGPENAVVRLSTENGPVSIAGRNE
jgi:hypothetical protein